MIKYESEKQVTELNLFYDRNSGDSEALNKVHQILTKRLETNSCDEVLSMSKNIYQTFKDRFTSSAPVETEQIDESIVSGTQIVRELTPF